MYGIQIYADFSGYSNIAIGAAEILGFELKQNFRQPYFACSIREFWKRWHISLSSWLQDYVYIPLGGSKKGVVRTYCNLILTFIVSAIWHGAGWKYIIWGGLHGIYQIIGKITLELRENICRKIGLKDKSIFLHMIQMVITFGLVDFAWLFFSAPSTKSAVMIIYRIVTEFDIRKTMKDGYYLLGLDESQFVVLFVGIMLLLAVDLIHENKISLTEWLANKHIILRWSVYIVIASILLLGIISNYGIEASSFLYAQF